MRHIHKYKKVVIGKKGYTVMKCQLPGCIHYINAKLAVSRETLCWQCNNPFFLSEESIGLTRPRCPDCRRRGRTPEDNTQVITIPTHLPIAMQAHCAHCDSTENLQLVKGSLLCPRHNYEAWDDELGDDLMEGRV